MREQQLAQEPQARTGDVLVVPVHGRGTVKAVEGDKIELQLPDGAVRKFKKDFVRATE